MNHMDKVTRGTFLHAKQEVTVAIDFLNSLTGHDIKVPELQQPTFTHGKQKGRRQDEPLKRVIDADDLEARDRAAAIILVFGLQAENIAPLTWNDVTITEELVAIRLGTIHIGPSRKLGPIFVS
jgi:hypothetical protein